MNHLLQSTKQNEYNSSLTRQVKSGVFMAKRTSCLRETKEAYRLARGGLCVTHTKKKVRTICRHIQFKKRKKRKRKKNPNSIDCAIKRNRSMYDQVTSYLSGQLIKKTNEQLLLFYFTLFSDYIGLT